MVLVDSSVWVRFLANKAPYSERLDQLLAVDGVLGHELVYGELLIGDCGGRREFLNNYRSMSQARTISHLEVVEFVRHRRIHGRSIGWVDVHLLASALVERVPLWTDDLRLAVVATELGIGYS